MRARLLSLIESLESRPLSLASFTLTLLAIILLRIGLENWLDHFLFRFSDVFFYQFTHQFLTFTTIFLASIPILAWAGRVPIRSATNILLAGFMIIWLPPIVDQIISHGAGLWSFYSFDGLKGLFVRYFTFFGDKPDVGITYGVRFEVGSVIIGIFLYTWIKHHSITRSLIAGAALYTTLFIIGVLPSIVTILLLGPSQGYFTLTDQDVARLMLSPQQLFILNPPDLLSVLAIKMSLIYSVIILPIITILTFSFFRPIFLSLWRNARFPQLAYHSGLFLMGAGLTFLYGNHAFKHDIFHYSGLIILLLSVCFAWLASVVVNDFADITTDRLTNPKRPLITGDIDPSTYRTIGLLFFAGSLLFSGILSTQMALLLFLYQALAWIYSMPPLRLKRYPIIATGLASLASLLIFFSGFIVLSAEKNITALPASYPILLFLVLLAILPAKDFKDIAGDQADHITTWPILLGAERAKRLIGSLIFLASVAAPFILGIHSLFLLGLFFGGVGYWLLQLSSETNRTLSYRKLPGWLMVLATSYGCFLALTLLHSIPPR